MEAKIDLEKYGKSLSTYVITKVIMEDKVFESLIDTPDQAKIFFIIAENLMKTGNEYLELINKKLWKN